MSIFGTKMRKRNKDIETLTMHVRDLHKRVRPVTDLEERISEFQQKVHDSRSMLLEQINTQSTRYNNLQERLRELTITNRLMQNQIDNFGNKQIISIHAESKGNLLKGEYFSYGNGSRENTGYVMTRRGQIIALGLSSVRQKDVISVAVAINGIVMHDYKVTLHTTPRKHDNFERPLIVEAGSMINFVSLEENITSESTVVCALVEII